MSAERYATLEALQSRLTDRSSEEATLIALLEAASTAVEDRCGRVFTRAALASERTFPARLSDVVTVDDIAASDSVTVDGSATGFRLTPQDAAERSRPFTEIRGTFSASEITVSAVWGWPLVPAPVTEAVLMLAARLHSRRGSPTGVAGFGDMGVVRVTATDADVASLLVPYVKVGFGA